MGVCQDVVKRIQKAEHERRTRSNSHGISCCKEELQDEGAKAARDEAGEAGGTGQERYDSEGNGRHYATPGCECIDAIEAATKGRDGYEGYLIGQCMKYLWRFRRKNQEDPALDLTKASWYLSRLIKYAERKDA